MPRTGVRVTNAARRIPLQTGKRVSALLRGRLTFVDPSTGRRKRFPTHVVGGVRRGDPSVKDLDILVVAPGAMAPRDLLPSVRLAPHPDLSIAEVYTSGPRRVGMVVAWSPPRGRKKLIAVDLFLATEREKPFALFHLTGPREYNIRVRAHAARAGYLLNQYGVFLRSSGRRAPGSGDIKTERQLAAFLGVTPRRPGDRR